MADAVHVRMIAPQLSPAKLPAVFEALEAEPLLALTHGSADERKRVPYSRESALAAASNGPIVVWRTRAPRYQGTLTTSRSAKNGFGLIYEPAPVAAELEALFGAATRLAGLLRPEWGFVHMLFRRDEDSKNYNRGMMLSGRDLDSFGIAGIHARTWFGPFLVSALRKDFLLAFPLATETAWGGVQIDLAPEPWAADFDTLRTRHAELMQRLQTTGMVGTFEGASIKYKPGPSWVSPGWDPKRRAR